MATPDATHDVSPVDWSHLTEDRAAILESYFSLFQTQDPTTIGSGEIVRWFRAHKRTAPSESLIRTVLGSMDLPRRRGGRPAVGSRASSR